MHFTSCAHRVCFATESYIYIHPFQELFFHCIIIISAFYWYVCASYNGFYIDIIVYVIQYNCWLNFILGICSYISPIYGLLFHCVAVKFTIVLIFVLVLYLCLLQYVGVLYTILSLVALHLDKFVIHISCI